MLDTSYTDLVEYMLEETMFNLMEEVSYEEFDLSQFKEHTSKKKTEVSVIFWIKLLSGVNIISTQYSFGSY